MLWMRHKSLSLSLLDCLTSSFYVTFPSCVKCIFGKKKKFYKSRLYLHTEEGAAFGPVDGLSSWVKME